MPLTLHTLHTSTADGATVVEAAGEIDVASAPKLRDCLNRIIDAGRRQLVVDLRQVDFMDSVGLGVLVGANRSLRSDHHTDSGIRLVCADGLVRQILRLTGLDRVFALHATLSDALGIEVDRDKD